MLSKITAIIDRIEGDFIVLKLQGDQELYWPKNLIEFNFAPGDMINLYLSKDEYAQEKSEDGAKNILRQIFQPNV